MGAENPLPKAEGRLNNACPNCAAVYSVQPQHVGRRIPCKKCGTPLIVTAEGISLDAGWPADGAGPESPPLESSPELDESYSLRRLAARPARTAPVLGSVREWSRGLFSGVDLPLWGFGVGLTVSLVAFFLPIIDQVQVARLRAAVQAGVTVELRREREWQARQGMDETERQQAREAAARERARLEEQLERGIDGALRWEYACRYGMLAGTLLMSVAALGFLGAGQSSARRICGAVVLTALALLAPLYLMLAGLSGR